MAKHTRTSAASNLTELVGPGKDFLPSEVPTWRAVFQRGVLLREEQEVLNGVTKFNYPLTKLAPALAKLVCKQWKKSNSSFVPPIILKEKTLSNKILIKWKQMVTVANGNASHKVTTSAISELDTLLDLCLCKHKIVLCDSKEIDCAGCSDKAHITCDCTIKTKIPKLELRWLFYQRVKTTEKSVLQISTVDYKETKRINNATKRKAQETDAALKQIKREDSCNDELSQRLQLNDDKDTNFDDALNSATTSSDFR